MTTGDNTNEAYEKGARKNRSKQAKYVKFKNLKRVACIGSKGN